MSLSELCHMVSLSLSEPLQSRGLTCPHVQPHLVGPMAQSIGHGLRQADISVLIGEHTHMVSSNYNSGLI